MSPRDTALLERWVARRDAEAFNELVSRYAGLVYATCKRILRNEADAEDVAQECFLTLAQTDTRAATSLAGWLHTVATRRSLNLLKRESRRRRRETIYAEQKPAAQVGWDDVKDCVDEAVEELPEKLRSVVVAHFLDRRTHNAIANELGITRRAVTNRIHKGVEAIRKSLRRRGVPVGTSALAAMLTTNAVEAAPATLASALGKIALAGAGTRIAVAAAGGGLVGGLAAMKSKVAILAVLVALPAGVGTYVALQDRRGPETEKTANRSELSQAPSPEPSEGGPSMPSVDEAASVGVREEYTQETDIAQAIEEEPSEKDMIGGPGKVVEAQETLEPKQLVKLIQASQERFSSFDLLIAKTTKKTITDPQGISRESESSSEIVMRWTPKHSYVRSASEKRVQQWESTRKWTKKLHETTDGSETPIGRVSKGPNSDMLPDGWPLFECVWSFTGLPWNWVLEQGPEVEWDDEAEVYVLRLSVQGLVFSMEVSPRLGYMPVSKTHAKLDGTLLTSFNLSDFREVGPGLWLPFQFTVADGPGEPERYETVYNILEGTVNENIPENLMEVVFPPGTIVDDYSVARTYLRTLWELCFRLAR